MNKPKEWDNGGPKRRRRSSVFSFFRGGVSREIGVGDIRYGLSSLNPFLPPSSFLPSIPYFFPSLIFVRKGSGTVFLFALVQSFVNTYRISLHSEHKAIPPKNDDNEERFYFAAAVWGGVYGCWGGDEAQGRYAS